MRTIVAYENGHVDLGAGRDAARVRDSLLRTTASLREEVFRVDRRGQLHARGVVGLVQADAVSVEILPKVRAGSEPEDDTRFLAALLSAAGLVPQRLLTSAAVQQRRMPLLEVVARTAAESLYATVGIHGIPHRYEEVREERETLIGTIDLARAMRQMPHERDRVPVIHAPRHYDNPLSRTLRALAIVLYSTSRSVRTRHTLRDVIDTFSEVAAVPLTPELVAAGPPAPDEEHWESAYQLARALSSGLALNPVEGGAAQTCALVFTLDDVFERVLRRSLAHALEGSGWHLAAGLRPRHYLVDSVTGRPRLRLRPDILVRSDDCSALQVADAKWKLLKIRPSGIALDRGDVYQLTAYMNRYGVSRGVLLVPKSDAMADVGGSPWSRRMCIAGSEAVIDVTSIDVPALVLPESPERAQALGGLRSAFTSVAP